MKEEKNKKDKKEEKTPKLVEVYGDEIKESVEVDKKDKKVKAKDRKEEVNKKGKKSLVSESKAQDKGKTPEEIVEEIIEERQAFKTEVVGEEEEKKEFNDQILDKLSDKKEMEKSRTITALDKDEIAFEEEIGNQKGSVRSVFGVGMFVFLIIFGLTGWAFYLKSVWLPTESVSEIVAEASPTPNSISTPTPISALLTREEITIDILNGSGVTGLAGKTATIFEELGYVLGKIGNADSVSENELYIKEESLNKLEVLYEDVLEELEISSPSGYLDEDEKVDARIVLGE